MQRVLILVIRGLALLSFMGVALGYGGTILFALDALAHFRLHFVVLAGLICVLCLILWRRAGAGWAGAAILLGLAGLGPLWERVPATDGGGVALVVMTANLHHRNPDPEAMRAALIAADADILVTHETTKATLGGDAPLSGHYPHRVMLKTSGTILRTVIWSRLPLRSGRLHLDDTIEPTGADAIVTLAPGVEVSVLGLHMAHAAIGNQEVQIAALSGIVRDLPTPRIVMGDLNTTPWSAAMRRIETATRTRRIRGYRVTWTGVYPVPPLGLPAVLGQPIDHILVSPGIQVDRIDVVAIPGSDHRAVRTRIRIRTP